MSEAVAGTQFEWLAEKCKNTGGLPPFIFRLKTLSCSSRLFKKKVHVHKYARRVQTAMSGDETSS